MGNRAVITFGVQGKSPCIYLHWNGGQASVEGFLRACRHLGINGHQPEAKAMDAISNTVARHFFGCDVGHTVYREEFGRSDTNNYDNGYYVIDKGLNIIRRAGEGSQHVEIDPKKEQYIFERITSSAPVYNS